MTSTYTARYSVTHTAQHGELRNLAILTSREPDAHEIVSYRVPAGADPAEVLYEAGWRTTSIAPDLADSTHAELTVEAADWPRIVETVTRNHEAAEAEHLRQTMVWRQVVAAAMNDPRASKSEVVKATGKSTARVYQIRDGKRS